MLCVAKFTELRFILLPGRFAKAQTLKLQKVLSCTDFFQSPVITLCDTSKLIVFSQVAGEFGRVSDSVCTSKCV